MDNGVPRKSDPSITIAGVRYFPALERDALHGGKLAAIVCGEGVSKFRGLALLEGFRVIANWQRHDLEGVLITSRQATNALPPCFDPRRRDVYETAKDGS